MFIGTTIIVDVVEKIAMSIFSIDVTNISWLTLP